MGRLTIEKMVELWPHRPAVALPQHDYNNLRYTQCQCATLSHGKKNCPIRGKKRCQLCGVAYDDNGSLFTYCTPCLDWWLWRRDYLAEWVVLNMGVGQMQGQLMAPAASERDPVAEGRERRRY